MLLYRRLLVLATLLSFCVIALGAYVRLSDAGLGCPDWPGCYGQLIGVPEAAHEQGRALEAFPGKPVQAHKTWKEMVHRYFAGTLGLLIVLLNVLTWRHRRAPGPSPLLAGALLAVVSVQAMLGMWTVTPLLRPVIVTAHLLGGMTTLALLVWLLLRQRRAPPMNGALRLPAALLLIAAVGQIALGGWVSSNYAALACADFPTYLGAWRPETDFAHAFQFSRELGQTADGVLLSNTVLSTIHWTHRVGALVVAALGGGLALALWRRAERRWALALAVAHNVGAAFLLTVTLALNGRLWQARAPAPPHPARPLAAETRGAHA